MRKFFPVLYAFVVVTPTLVPAAVFAQEGIVPCTGLDCSLCSVGQLAQNIINFLLAISIPIAAVMFAYAGVLYMSAGGDPGRIGRAHKIFKSVGIGFAIAISGWLVVQTVLSTVFDDKFWVGGSWNELQCVEDSKRLKDAELSDLFNEVFGGVKVEPIVTPTGEVVSCPAGSVYDPERHTCFVTGVGNWTAPIQSGSGVLCTNSACNPSFLQSFGYTPAQANVMSCIAVTESGGDPGQVNPDGGACGTFQILPSNWRKPGLHSGSCSTVTSCTNSYCNAQTAYLLSYNRMRSGQSPYSDWTCPGCNAKAQGCVDKYDPAYF